MVRKLSAEIPNFITHRELFLLQQLGFPSRFCDIGSCALRFKVYQTGFYSFIENYHSSV